MLYFSEGLSGVVLPLGLVMLLLFYVNASTQPVLAAAIVLKALSALGSGLGLLGDRTHNFYWRAHILSTSLEHCTNLGYTFLLLKYLKNKPFKINSLLRTLWEINLNSNGILTPMSLLWIALGIISALLFASRSMASLRRHIFAHRNIFTIDDSRAYS